MYSMISSKFLLATVVVISTLAITGCNSDDSASAPPTDSVSIPAVQPEWASPAMYVPDGQSSVTLTTSSCTSYAIQGNPTPIYSGSVVIYSSGDMALMGATSQGGSVTELARFNQADATERYLYTERYTSSGSSSSSSSVTNYDEVELENYVPNSIDKGFYVNDEQAYAYSYSYLTQTYDVYIDCDLTTPLTRVREPNNARAAAKFLNGVTSILPYNSQWTNSAGIANGWMYFDNMPMGGSMPMGYESLRYMGFNLSSGDAVTSADDLLTNPNAARTSFSLAFPNNSFYNGYEESFEKGASPELDEYSLARYFEVDTNFDGEINLYKVGNQVIFYPGIGYSNN